MFVIGRWWRGHGDVKICELVFWILLIVVDEEFSSKLNLMLCVKQPQAVN
jgi:hypothetical protein